MTTRIRWAQLVRLSPKPATYGTRRTGRQPKPPGTLAWTKLRAAGCDRRRPVHVGEVRCESTPGSRPPETAPVQRRCDGDVAAPLGSEAEASSAEQQPDNGAAGGASTSGRSAGPAAEAAAENGAWPWSWGAVPARYKVVVATSLAFVICNMDKVNISVAIIPMAQQFGWSPTTAGLVQSSFFYGYLLSQLPGGFAASLLGGRAVLPAGVGLWSAATAGVPFLAATVPGLFLSRAAVGLGEGVAPSAATDIVARIIDTTERSRAISFIFGGLHVGSLLGLFVAPAIIDRLGWPTVFYLFGGMGLAWALWWERLMASITETDPAVAEALSRRGGTSRPTRSDADEHDDGGGGGASQQSGGHGGAIPHDQPVPWRAFLRNRPVGALAFAHFCNNWFHYTMLAWLPTYFSDTLDLNLMAAARVSILPPVAAIAVSAVAGPLADGLISRRVPIARVRKAAQLAAFLGPAACLGAAGWGGGGGGGVELAVPLITLSLGLASFSLAGLYSNHADLSPRYAPVLLGLTGTAGSLPGILGVAVTGWLYDATNSWPLALFAPSILFFVAGSAVYAAYGSAERQDFAADNEPFGGGLRGAGAQPDGVDASRQAGEEPDSHGHTS